ncbi:pectic acid lyase [bacterium]|nr:pectic acid lyase [bacterium]
MTRNSGRREFLALTALASLGRGLCFAASLDKAQARAALEKAVGFFVDRIARHGGYVYKYSDDLAHSQGEVVTGPDTVWVQPPGTPEVGQALLDVFEMTQLPKAREGALAAARCLVRGQLRSGGWTDKIEFAPEARSKIAYRIDPPRKKPGFDVSTFDDDKTQSAVRFLLHFDHAFPGEFADVHESVTFALESILKSQYPNGGFAQGWAEPAGSSKPADPKARYPETWSRTWPAYKEYWRYYTFNDGNVDRTIETLLLATRLTGDPKYRDAAIRAGDFVLAAQMPAPQPAWAQQSDFEMQPVWARKFEPPAISGGESQRLIETLMNLYVVTDDKKYLRPISLALDWLDRVALPDGRLARFYELKTDRPLYFTRSYELTYDDSDVPTHYAFKVGNRAKSLRKRFETLMNASDKEMARQRDKIERSKSFEADPADVAKIVGSIDLRGAWVEPGKIDKRPAGSVISSVTFCENVRTLAAYVGSNP